MKSSFVPLAGRDAAATIRGFLYQIQLTVLRWIELDPTATLELESGEDIDTVRQALLDSEPERKLEQIKHRARPISFKSPEVLVALVNFFRSRVQNPGIPLRFRFLTNNRAALERGNRKEQTLPAIQVWNAISDTAKADEADLKLLRDIVLGAARPARAHKPDWESMTAFFQTAADDELLAFVKSVEWSVENPSVPQLADKIASQLIQRGFVDALHADAAYNQLVSYVLKRLSAQGIKRLTQPELADVLRELEKTAVNPALINIIRLLVVERRDATAMVEELQKLVKDLAARVDAQESVDAQLDAIATNVSLAVPPALANGSLRAATVDRCAQALTNVGWLSLQGESGSGKTQLAILLAARASHCVWIDFRDTDDAQQLAAFDASLAVVAHLPRDVDTNRWYTAVISRLQADTVVFIDDLPSASGILQRVITFVRCAIGKPVKVVSTSRHPLRPSPSEWLGSSFLEISAPTFCDDEIREYCIKNGAPVPLVSHPSFIRLVEAVTRRHPQLLAALVRYMQGLKWQYDQNVLIQLLKGAFAEDTRVQTRRVLAKTLPEATRHFLYRLNVVGPFVTDDDVLLVSAITPTIPLPMDKLAECLDVWLQRQQSRGYVLSALVSQVGSDDIPEPTRKSIHAAKARSLVNAKVMNQLDALSAIVHFQMAGRPKAAAKVLLIALQGLNEHGAAEVDDFGLLSIWADTDIPVEVDAGVQIIIRALQVSARKKHRRPFGRVLQRLDRLLATVAESDQVATYAGCSCVGIALTDQDPAKALSYLLQALAVEHHAKPYLPHTDIHLADVLWFAAPGLDTPDKLMAWLETVGGLTQEQRERLFDFTYVAARSSRFICDRFWSSEADREYPNFSRLDQELERLERAALRMDARVLIASVARARIAIATSYEGNLEKGTALAELALRQLNDDYADFLLSFTLGTGCTDAQDWERAVLWLTRAIEAQKRQASAQVPEFVVRAYLSRARALTRMSRPAEADCLEAVKYAKSTAEIPELMLVKTLAELAIAIWTSEDKARFYEVWEEVVNRTLRVKNDSHEWKGLFVLNGNNGAYFSSMVKGRTPLPVVTEPFQGMYMLHSPQLPSLYASETEWYIAAAMVWLAEDLGKFDDVSRWALRAVEMASSSLIGEQAKFFLLYAAPQMVRERRYVEALEFVLESAKGMQASDEPVAAFAESHGKDELLQAVRGRKVPTPAINAELLTVVLLPIMLDLACWRVSDLEQAASAAEDIAAKCRDLGLQSTDPHAWTIAADRIVAVFSSISRKEITQQADRDSDEGKYLAASIGFAGSADVFNPEHTFVALFRSLEFFERQFGHSPVHRRLVAELTTKFWRTALLANPLGFRQPSALNRQLSELETEETYRPRDVMRVVHRHLGLQVPPYVQAWLDTPPGEN